MEGDDLVLTWYNEKEDYDFDTEQFSLNTHNFTQLIWKKSEKIGFGFSINDEEHLYMIAFFYPAGNIANQFKDNVLPSLEDRDEKSNKKSVPEVKNVPNPEPKLEPKPETPQEKFIREALNAHNNYRRKHGVPELTHDPELSRVAQNYANYLARINTLKHSDCNFNGNRMGENLAMIMDSRLNSYPGIT